MRLRAFVSAFAVLASQACHAEENGVVLLQVVLQFVDDVAKGARSTGGNDVDAYWIKNLETGRRYGGRDLYSEQPKLIDVPAGVYCVDSMTGWSTHIDYCGEPFFRVESGQLSNAGRWWFLFGGKNRQELRLFASVEKPDRVLKRAKDLFPDRFLPTAK